MPQKYQHKQIQVQAMQWTGANFDELKSWGAPVVLLPGFNNEKLILGNLNGQVDREIIRTVAKGDWIVQNVNNEFIAFKSGVFEQMYEKLA
jgi:hypothetical protein